MTENETTLPAEPIRRFGWLPDKPDQRDLKIDRHPIVRRYLHAPQRIPSKVDLRETGYLGDVVDQGNLGSCTANAIAKAYEFAQRKQGLPGYQPSRLFIYYGEREIEQSIPYDSGAFIRDGLKVVNKLGAPDERFWPYRIQDFAERPTDIAYQDGQSHQAIEYRSVDVKTTAMKATLAAGFPFVVGFTVYTSFFNIGADGFMPIPKQTERVEGGHAVLSVGYRRMRAPWDSYAKDYGIFLNSWGPLFGAAGYFYGRLSWFGNRYNADDFWAITKAEV